MDKVNYFLKALVLVIMVRCTMNYLLPSPDTITFKILDGLAFGVLIGLLEFLRSIHKNKSFIYVDFEIVKNSKYRYQ